MTYEEVEKEVRKRLWDPVKIHATEKGFEEYMNLKETIDDIKLLHKWVNRKNNTKDDIESEFTQILQSLWWDYAERR